MSLDPRTPVIVGVGQSIRRPTDDAEPGAPLDLMVAALRAAGHDSGSGDQLLRAADSVRVVNQLSWRYPNAPLAVATELGATPRQLLATSIGGNTPQFLVNHCGAGILRGELDIALICGAEAVYSRRQARRTGTTLPWWNQPAGTPAPDLIGLDQPGSSDGELAASLTMPTQVYPLFENALRAGAGESIEDHQVRISELWARFSEVAAENPWAWSQAPLTAEKIRTVDAGNRMIGFPYPKLMNANIQTDQGAAVIICSAEAARAAGVDEDRWVFPHSGADGHDHWFVSNRWDLTSSPAIAACGAAVLGDGAVSIDEIAHVDLYSCFPAAVQIGAAALGFPLDDPRRSPTVTGGLSFAGGPGNNYVTHSIATMVEVLRSDPGSWGLVSGLGWYLTKHSLGLYSTAPPPSGFRHTDVQAQVDALPHRDAVTGYTGPVTVETSTVLYERDGTPSLGIVAGLTPDGQRTWANTHQPDLIQLLTTEEMSGRSATLASDGFIHVP